MKTELTYKQISDAEKILATKTPSDIDDMIFVGDLIRVLTEENTHFQKTIISQLNTKHAVKDNNDKPIVKDNMITFVDPEKYLEELKEIESKKVTIDVEKIPKNKILDFGFTVSEVGYIKPLIDL